MDVGVTVPQQHTLEHLEPNFHETHPGWVSTLNPTMMFAWLANVRWRGFSAGEVRTSIRMTSSEEAEPVPMSLE